MSFQYVPIIISFIFFIDCRIAFFSFPTVIDNTAVVVYVLVAIIMVPIIAVFIIIVFSVIRAIITIVTVFIVRVNYCLFLYRFAMPHC